MVSRVMVALATLAGLGIGTPVASAAEPSELDCGFNVVAQETATGGQDTFTGVAYGHVAFAVTEAESVTIRCDVRVNGVVVSSTATATGTGFASGSGQVTYTASETDDVDLCAEWTAGSAAGSECVATYATQVPPQQVVDLLNDALEAANNVPDPGQPLFCTAIPRGQYPPDIEVEDDDGDIYRGGSRVLDCAPLNDEPSPMVPQSYLPTWVTDLR